MPKVSVLMPVYNTPEYILRDTINSIINQTYKDFEFLIINDSPENCDLDRIINSYNDKRIKYYKNKTNKGISYTRNKLIELSQGEYLAICDHDDISKPDRFIKQIEYLDKNKDVGVVGSNFYWTNSGQPTQFPSDDFNIKLKMMEGCVLSHPTTMIRKQVLIENNICYREEFSPAEDYMLWAELIDKTQFHNIEDVLLYYRFDYGAKEKSITNQSILDSERMKYNDSRIKCYLYHKYPYFVNFNLANSINNIMTFLNFEKTYRFKKWVYLFGFIPILKIKGNRNKKKYYLFGFIQIFKIKEYD